MKNSRMPIWMVSVALAMAAGRGVGMVEFNDGGTHNINYTIDDRVRLDYLTANNPGTNLTLGPGGSIAGLFELYNNSRLSISRGHTEHYIVLYGNSQVSVTSGSLRWSITSFDESRVTFSNGTIGGGAGGGIFAYGNSDITISGGRNLAGGYAADNSHMTFSGGQIDLLAAGGNGQLIITGGKIDRFLRAEASGQITLVGTDFKINGVDVEHGKTAQDYEYLLSKSVNSDGISTWSGAITGQLSDGSYMENAFDLIDIYGYARGDIIFVPEPVTLLLLGLGGLVLKRK